MAVQSVFPSFSNFTDDSGKPLQNGYLFIGVAGLNPEINPIPVYWDAAMTIPAAQPIRTVAGYPHRNGTIGALYVSGDYSLIVRDKDSRLVYSSLWAMARYGAAVISLDAYGVSFTQTGVGAIPSSVAVKLNESVSVKDYGAIGDGVTDDTVAIQAALDSVAATGGGIVQLPRGKYKTTAPLTIQNGGIRLVGDGVGRYAETTSSIEYYGTGNAIECTAPSADGFGLLLSSFSVEDMLGTGQAAILIEEFTFGFEVSHVFTVGFEIGINSIGGNFRGILAHNRHKGARTWGIQLERIAGVGAVRSNRILIENVLIDGVAGIYLNDTINVVISNCDMESIAYSMNKAIKCNNTQNTIIRENYIELNVAATNGVIELAGGNSCPLITGNLISSIVGTATLVYMSNCTRATIMNNLFTAGAASTTTAIHGASANVTNCAVINNRYTPTMATKVDWTGGTKVELLQIEENKITLGTDTAIYRSDVNTLKTDGAVTMAGVLIGNRQQVYNKTADYPVLASESGCTFSNNGTSATIILTLPTSAAGLTYRFVRNSASYALRIDPNGTEIIRNGASIGGAGKYLSLDINGGNVQLLCSAVGVWEVVSAVGTTSFEV